MSARDVTSLSAWTINRGQYTGLRTSNRGQMRRLMIIRLAFGASMQTKYRSRDSTYHLADGGYVSREIRTFIVAFSES